MKTNLYELAEECLYAPSIEDKLAVTDQAARIFERRGFVFEHAKAPHPVTEACFPERSRPVDPRHLPRRSLNTEARREAGFSENELRRLERLGSGGQEARAE